MSQGSNDKRAYQYQQTTGHPGKTDGQIESRKAPFTAKDYFKTNLNSLHPRLDSSFPDDSRDISKYTDTIGKREEGYPSSKLQPKPDQKLHPEKSSQPLIDTPRFQEKPKPNSKGKESQFQPKKKVTVKTVEKQTESLMPVPTSPHQSVTIRKSKAKPKFLQRLPLESMRFVNDPCYLDPPALASEGESRSRTFKNGKASDLWQRLRSRMRTSQKFKSMKMFLRIFENARNDQDLERSRLTAMKAYLEDRAFNYSIRLQRLLRVIHPDENFHFVWSICVLVSIMIQLVLIPLSISFDYFTKFMMAILVLIEVFFIIDILLNFNTGYYKKGDLTLRRRKICYRYLKSGFIPDLLTSFPCLCLALFIDPLLPNHFHSQNVFVYKSLLSITDPGHWFFLLQLIHALKVYKLKSIFRDLEDRMQINDFRAGIVGVLKLGLTIFFIAHFCACIFHFIALEMTPYVNLNPVDAVSTWIHEAQLEESSWQTRYIAALYWATSTMVTVGYGDVVATNNAERTFCMVVMYIACGVFAYMMNTISRVIQRFELRRRHYHERIDIVNRFMGVMHLDHQLQIRVRKYLEYIWDLDNIPKESEREFLSSLTPDLRDSICRQRFGRVLEKCQGLRGNFSKAFISALALRVEEVSFQPGQMIFDADDKLNEDLYMITQGHAEVYVKSSNTILATLKPDDHFGEVAFYTGEPRTADVRSVLISKAVRIPKAAFIDVIKGFPADHEKYCQIRDSAIFQRDLSVLKIRCYGCHSEGHVAKYCPKLHRNVDDYRFAVYYNDNLKNLRSRFRRSPRQKFSSMVEFATIRARAAYFKQQGTARDDPGSVNDNDIQPMTAGILPAGYASQYSSHPRDTTKGGKTMREQQTMRARPSAFGVEQPFYQVVNNPQNRLVSESRPPDQTDPPEAFRVISGLPDVPKDRVLISEYTANELQYVPQEKSKRIIFDTTSHSRKPSDRGTIPLAEAFNKYIYGSYEEPKDVQYEFDAVATFEIYFPESNIGRIKYLINYKFDEIVPSMMSPLKPKPLLGGDSSNHKGRSNHAQRQTIPLLRLSLNQADDSKTDSKGTVIGGKRRPSSVKKVASPQKRPTQVISFEMSIRDFPFARDSMSRGERGGFTINAAFLHTDRKKEGMGLPFIITGDQLSGSVPRRVDQVDSQSRKRSPDPKQADDFGDEKSW